MKPIGKRIIAKFDLQQKETLQYGSLRLFIPNKSGHNENAREGYPTCAEIIDGGKSGLKKGDIAVFVHTILENNSSWIEKNDNHVTLTLPYDGSITIYGKLDKNGDVVPMFGNLVCKRIEKPSISNIIITPDAYKKTEDYKAQVIRVSKGSDIKVGSTVLYYRYSDYELVYNVNGEEKRVILVKRQDVVAVEN